MEFAWASRTDVGRVRSRNEDALLCDGEIGFFMVADGMGGHQGGEEASRIACETVVSFLRRHGDILERAARDPVPVQRRAVAELLGAAFREANEAIVRASDRDAALQGMGSTGVALVLAGDRAFIAHVGDSRAYLIRDRMATLLTEDHSLLFELLRQGRLARSQVARFPMKNVVTQALGIRGEVQPEVMDLPCLPGDRFLLSSDGFHGTVEDERLPRLCEGPLETVAERLVSFANASGGADNITAVVLEIGRIDGDPIAIRERLRRIRETPLFGALTMGELFRVLSRADHFLARPGEVLVREGDRLDGILVVLSGEVEVLHGDQVWMRLGTGGTFGEVCLVEDRPAEVALAASAPTEVALVSRRWFETEAGQHPAMALRMMRQVARGIAQRLRAAQQDLARLGDLVDVDALPSRFGEVLPDQFDFETEVTPVSGLPTVQLEDRK
ncbi:protein phosphatase 2C domain-containing protein [Myxococcota bacterium]|nr:protein phosphatase 2C domain-containing protein [Myxococcota bacterium]